jgi:PPOX class probable F420-dependent enzyme
VATDAAPTEPVADRPYMPDYGIAGPTEGSGLLPWSWAEDRLHAATNLWVATVWPDGRPHLSVVWGVWMDGAAWFSCGLRSRKIQNLRANPACTIANDDSNNPVTVQGVAEVIRDRTQIREFLDALNAKYASDVDEDFLDPDANATVRVTPHVAYTIKHDDFHGSPTRWRWP